MPATFLRIAGILIKTLYTMNKRIKKANKPVVKTNTTTHKLASYGNRGLHTIQTPSELWIYVGSVPMNLMIKKTGPFGEYYDSPKFSTKQQAIDYFNKHKPAK